MLSMVCEVSGLLNGDAECQSSLATLDLDLSAAYLAKDVSIEAFGGGCGPLALGVELGAPALEWHASMKSLIACK